MSDEMLCSQGYTRFVAIVLRYRRILVVWLHLMLIILASYLAFWLRFDGAIPQEQQVLWAHMLPWLVAVQGIMFVPFGLYRGLWRYTSLWDLRNIILGVLVGVALSFLLTHGMFGLRAIPRSVFALDALLLIFLLSGVRLVRRLMREARVCKSGTRVLVYGAGDAGEMIVRDMKNNAFYAYEPIGFVDDDLLKVGKRIHGVRVLGTRDALPQIMATKRPQEVLIALPSAAPTTLREVVKALQHFKVSISTLPNLRDIMDGKATVTQIRDLAVEDLLERDPIGWDTESVRHMIAGKRILVTGAGGSIGAELCRQIGALHPSTLGLYERYENNLYALSTDLAERCHGLNVHYIVGDVTDTRRIHDVMAEHQPEIIFHAAAHKHVPLMEGNLCEAVKNNVGGTHIVAEAAAHFGAERFILISTDKAVNPTSVMGATKRVAELLVLGLARRSQTRFVAVRFGNVLGSNGSVVPRFLDQIRAGGPVTVTHPEMQRYFMLIPEAVHLVLHAATWGHSGTVYVLEMGEQIKVLDMARNLIRLSGFIPDEEIPITFVGLRPGEKLYEELVGSDEILQPSGVEKIYQVQVKTVPESTVLLQHIATLEQLAIEGASKEVFDCLSALVPTYHPVDTVAEPE